MVKVFLSYRVVADKDLVERLHDKLKAKGVDVWWDHVSLEPGQPWEQGFADGLCDATIFVPVISKAALAPFASLTASSSCDNVLLEYRLALELQKRGQLLRVFPVLVGNITTLPGPLGELHGDFFSDGGLPLTPDVVVACVETKLEEHLNRKGLGAPVMEDRSVKGVLGEVVKFQGIKLMGLKYGAMEKVVDSVAGLVRQMSKRPMQVEPPQSSPEKKAVQKRSENPPTDCTRTLQPESEEPCFLVNVDMVGGFGLSGQPLTRAAAQPIGWSSNTTGRFLNDLCQFRRGHQEYVGWCDLATTQAAMKRGSGPTPTRTPGIPAFTEAKIRDLSKPGGFLETQMLDITDQAASCCWNHGIADNS